MTSKAALNTHTHRGTHDQQSLTQSFAIGFTLSVHASAPLSFAFCLGAVTLCVAILPANAAPSNKTHPAAHKKAAARTKTVDIKSSLAPTAAAAPAAAAPQVAGAPPPSRGPSRIDFDDRLIQGQTNKSGAVYLYDRKELKNRSMIKTPDTFRQQIVGSVYDSP